MIEKYDFGRVEKADNVASTDIQLREMKLAWPSAALVELRASRAKGFESAVDAPPDVAKA